MYEENLPKWDHRLVGTHINPHKSLTFKDLNGEIVQYVLRDAPVVGLSVSQGSGIAADLSSLKIRRAGLDAYTELTIRGFGTILAH